MSTRFRRTRESFICQHCGCSVAGNGYTNHCPRCLWSKHVDVHPGDRRADCGGLMEPVRLRVRGARYSITHRCVDCGYEKNNLSAPDDAVDELIRLSALGT